MFSLHQERISKERFNFIIGYAQNSLHAILGKFFSVTAAFK
jgi:hypothetical protein